MTYTIPEICPIGDGKTDDTVAIQSMLDANPVVVLPRPRVGYLVSSLLLNDGQEFSGSSRKYPCLIGNGIDTVLSPKTMDGLSRDITLNNLNVLNRGAKCFACYYSPDLTITNCNFAAYGSGAVDIRFSWRVKIDNNKITCSGDDFTALKCIDNVNGLVLTANSLTGGLGGRACIIEQSQALTILGNRIESSLHGMAISSSDEVGKGNCNAVTLQGNYFEQCSTPLSLGTQSTVFGLDCSSNYFGNSAESTLTAREAVFSIGRLQQSSIQCNTIWTHPREDIFRFHWITPTGAVGNPSVLQDTIICRNYVHGKPANYVQYLGKYGPNESVQRTVGGHGCFDFCNGFDSHGTQHKREWISPAIDASEGFGPYTWLPADKLELGGKIFKVELIDVTKDLPSCVLQIGRLTNIGETVSQDLNGISVVGGNSVCKLVTQSPLIWSTADNLINVTPGLQARPATFRIKITYRAQ